MGARVLKEGSNIGFRGDFIPPDRSATAATPISLSSSMPVDKDRVGTQVLGFACCLRGK